MTTKDNQISNKLFLDKMVRNIIAQNISDETVNQMNESLIELKKNTQFGVLVSELCQISICGVDLSLAEYEYLVEQINLKCK